MTKRARLSGPRPTYSQAELALAAFHTGRPGELLAALNAARCRDPFAFSARRSYASAKGMLKRVQEGKS